MIESGTSPGRLSRVLRQFSEVRRQAIAWFVLLLVLLIGVSGLNVVNSYVGRDFMTAISDAAADGVSSVLAVALRRRLRRLDGRGGLLPVHRRSGSGCSGALADAGA